MGDRSVWEYTRHFIDVEGSKETAAGISQEAQVLAARAQQAARGTDPPYVPDREVFDAYTHQQIWDLVYKSLNPEALGQISSSWKAVGDRLEDVFDTFSAEVRRESAEWSGSFAIRAQSSTDAFVLDAASTQRTCQHVEQLMGLNSSAAQNIRASILEPKPPYVPDPDPAVEAADGGGRRRRYNETVAELTADAQDTMNYLYNPTLPASGDSVPRFVPPPLPIVDPPPPPVEPKPEKPNGFGGTSGTDNSGTDEQDGEPKEGQPEEPSSENPEQGAPASTQTQSSSFTSPAITTSSTTTAPTVPAGVNPTDNQRVMPSSTTNFGPASVPGSATTGSPENRPQPGPGTARPALPQTLAGANPAAAARAATGTPFAPMGGVPGAGRGQGSDSEETKGSPDYLRRRYEELDQVDPAVPPVIGADAYADEPLPPPGGRANDEGPQRNR